GLLITLFGNRNAVKTADGGFRRNRAAGRSGVPRLRDGDDLKRQPVRVGEAQYLLAETAQRRFHLIAFESLRPEIDGALRHAETDRSHLGRPDPAARRTRPGEKRQDGPGASGFVPVVQVVTAGVVEVHGELYQPQPQDAAVEVNVLLRVGG